VELRGQSEIPLVTDDTTPLRDDQLETPEALVDTAGPTCLDALPPMISESRPNESSGVGYLTFFDVSNDATSLTQDLDWLFGVGVDSWDDASAGLYRFNNILNPATEQLPVWSPLSGTSSQGSATNAVENAAHLVPRQKVLSALVTLPADVLSSSFFDAANLEWFMQSYWENYNPHFSLLHRPTFSVQDAPPLLLVALLTLGATLSPDRDHYQVAEKIHESLRWLIFTVSGIMHLHAPYDIPDRDSHQISKRRPLCGWCRRCWSFSPTRRCSRLGSCTKSRIYFITRSLR
jgi:hypothetical protein